MIQGALPLDWPAAAGEGDFLIGAPNRLAVRHLEHWSLWPVMATILQGPRKSGRSLLGRIFAARSGGELVDGIAGADEEALFHAWNRAQARRRPLILIADDGPLGTPTLADLRSRLAATPAVRIGPPDDALAAQLVERLCLARGLAAPPELVRYLVPRLERSYVAIVRAVDALDALAFERRQGLTVPLARRALGQMGVIDASHREE